MTAQAKETEANDGDRQDRLWLSLVAARGRDAEGALRGLFDKYNKRLQRFLVHRGATPHTAEDLVQETFIKVWKSAEGFRGASTVSSWIHRIAINASIDEATGGPVGTTVNEEVLTAAINEDDKKRTADRQREASEEEALAALQACYEEAFGRFAKDSPLCAQALARVQQDAWSMREIAAMLKRTEGATREFLSQCRKKLKRFMEPCAPLLKELG